MSAPTPRIPVRYRSEFRDRLIPYGEARALLKPGDLVLYAAGAYVCHTVELLRFYQAGSYPYLHWRARVRQLPSGWEWSVDPEELFAYAAAQEVDRREVASLNTVFTRRLEERFSGEYFASELKSFLSLHPRLTDAQAQLAAQALKMVYIALSEEDQLAHASAWALPELAPYRQLRGDELKPGFQEEGITPLPKESRPSRSRAPNLR